MQFDSLVFLIFFLPISAILYHFIGGRGKNILLVFLSLFFYSWGSLDSVLLLLFTITINYIAGRFISKRGGTSQQILFILIILYNLSILFFYKYFSFTQSIFTRFFGLHLTIQRNITQPLGIAFFTLTLITYICDLKWRKTVPQTKWIDFALYVSFFPCIISGPIIKYHDIVDQLTNHPQKTEDIAEGLQRFSLGLAKKVLIANQLGFTVDRIYELPLEQMSTPFAWTAAIFYTLQIYYDFSGYSDMAIGIAAFFGFRLKENFLFPYTAVSIRDFWRKWHISLSSWYKEYLYIPLGGNRKGSIRTYLNLAIVFFCTGIWHGASIHFIFWGLYHGFFIILERILTSFLGQITQTPLIKAFRHIYVIMVVGFGWIFFRVPGLRFSFKYIRMMFSSVISPAWNYFEIISPYSLFIAAAAILLCGFFQTTERPSFLFKFIKHSPTSASVLARIFSLIMFMIAFIEIISGSYLPFIYSRF